MWTFSVSVVLLVCPFLIFSYNTNRQIVLVAEDNCNYYENPAFQLNPNLLQSRISDLRPTQPVGYYTDNSLKKEVPLYAYQKYDDYHKPPIIGVTKYEPKIPITFFPNMSPASSTELRFIDDGSQEEDIKIDYDKLWKVGEIPITKEIKALPDVYVKPEDAPPVVDMLSVEQSELTAEAHDLEDVEIEEMYLHDPVSETQEVIIENVTTRSESLSTENPAIAIFKNIEIKEKKNPEEKSSVKVEKKVEETIATTLRSETNKSENFNHQKGTAPFGVLENL